MEAERVKRGRGGEEVERTRGQNRLKKYRGMKRPYDNLQSSDLIKNNNNKMVKG